MHQQMKVSWGHMSDGRIGSKDDSLNPPSSCMQNLKALLGDGCTRQHHYQLDHLSNNPETLQDLVSPGMDHPGHTSWVACARGHKVTIYGQFLTSENDTIISITAASF